MEKEYKIAIDKIDEFGSGVLLEKYIQVVSDKIREMYKECNDELKVEITTKD